MTVGNKSISVKINGLLINEYASSCPCLLFPMLDQVCERNITYKIEIVEYFSYHINFELSEHIFAIISVPAFYMTTAYAQASNGYVEPL